MEREDYKKATEIMAQIKRLEDFREKLNKHPKCKVLIGDAGSGAIDVSQYVSINMVSDAAFLMIKEMINELEEQLSVI